MARDDIPGVAVCFIHEGEPAWMEGLGVTDRRANREVTPDTLFSIQSTSKNITAAAIMLAVQQGILDLDEPITTYLPDFTVQSRREATPQRKMTLRMLLANRAGFTHEAPIGNNYDPASPSFEAHVRSISRTWLRFPVGERYRYSNLGFDLAGYILQVRSGRPFRECLERTLFEQLGMRSTTVDPDVYLARSGRALGHDTGYPSVPPETPLIPSGGVHTSARDMAAYCMFHLGRGRAHDGTLLQERFWNEMHAFPFGDDYSLGVIRRELRHGRTDVHLMTHHGGGFGYGCVFYYCPQAALAWVALFNRPVSAAYRFGEQLIEDALTRAFGPATPRMPVDDAAPLSVPSTQLRKYAGNYVGRDAIVDLEVVDGTLGMRQDGKLTPIRFLSPDRMYVARPDEDVLVYRYSPPSALAPAHLECSVGEKSLDYNDGAHDVAGPDRPGWNRYIGTYRIDRWGKQDATVLVRRKNGYLYLDRTRLITELEPGLFFTSDGEAVDLRDGEPTWRNIRLHRLD